MSRCRETRRALVLRRDERLARFVVGYRHWTDGGALRCSQWRREGVERCRRWAEEGSHRPGELAPPSWFFIGMRFGIAWYRINGRVGQAWYRLAGWVCRAAGWVLYGLLTGAAYLLACVPASRRSKEGG